MVTGDPTKRGIRLKLKWVLVAVFCVGAVAASIGIPTRASYGARVTGDEPQYLITAVSLYEDADLDVSNQIDDGDYLPFHEIPLDRQTEPLEGGREVSPHDPLLPAALALPMGLGGWVAAKLMLALINGILAVVLLWTAVRRLDLAIVPAALIVSLFVASPPLAVYGNQIYPELPAALVVATALALLLGTLRRWTLPALGACIVVLPWLSVKYAPVAAVIAVAALWRAWKMGERTRAYGLAGALGIAAVAFVGAHLEWYGGVTSYASGDHFASTGEFSVVGTQVNLVGRSSRLIGLVVDRHFGLAAWQPAYLLGIVALGAVAKMRDRAGLLLAGVLLSGWLVATFMALTMHGWWWPGRQTVIVLPALILLIARWTTPRLSARRTAYVLGAVGIFSYLWLAAEGAAGGLTWVVDFFETTNPVYRVWRSALPDYMQRDGATWVLHAAWSVAAVALALLGWRSEERGPGRAQSETVTSVAMPSAK